MTMCSNRLMIKYVRKCKWAYHRFGMKYVVLLFFYIWYIVLGAVVFYALEHENVKYLNMLWRVTLNTERSIFIRSDLMPLIFNNSVFLQFINDQRTKGIAGIVERQLVLYERRLGVEYRMAGAFKEWRFEHALVYSVSLCTTIGYGLIHPLTSTGRVVSVLYSLLGIPFTMLLVRDWSRLAARLLNYPGSLVIRCWDWFRYCTLRSVGTVDELKALREQHRIIMNNVVLNIPTSVAFFAMVGWIVLGAFAFCWWESSWTVLDSFLFCYNSLTTVGEIGNTIPREPRLLVLMLVYVYCGLAVVSLFIDLIYAKFLLAYKPVRFVVSRREQSTSEISRSSNDNESVDRGLDRDVDLGSCVTLGIMRMDGRAHKNDYTFRKDQQECVSRSAQTRVTVPEKRTVQLAAVSEDGNSYQHLILPIEETDHRSHDDVTTLLVETYSSRPHEV